jgi:DNA-directed RNA polymerase specialized sigma24 family protein
VNREFIDMIFRGEYLELVTGTILYVMSKKINQHDLNDCISEVYMIALTQKDLDKHPNIHGWLTETAKNVAKQFKKKRVTQLMRSHPDYIEATDAANVEEIIENKEQDKEFLAYSALK